MSRPFLLALSALVTLALFLSCRPRHTREQAAVKQKARDLRARLAQRGISGEFHLFLRAFKQEKTLEVWVRSADAGKFRLFRRYPFCALSGKLGPKWEQGDRQVPEGFYQIDAFNPLSRHYLSLRVNYPNAADVIRSTASDRGGDIYIHGGCSTVGCIPITDDKIKEVYVLAMWARDSGQSHIPVHIFPARLNRDNFSALKRGHAQEPRLVNFWDNLREGFEYFEKTKRVPEVSVNATGRYEFQK